MKSHSPNPDIEDVRAAIKSYAPHDLLRVVVMWLIPLIFLGLNKWAWHWGTLLTIMVVGVFVIGGTTLSIPAIALRSLPPDHSSVWTPVRSLVFVAIYLTLWGLTYAAVK